MGQEEGEGEGRGGGGVERRKGSVLEEIMGGESVQEKQREGRGR